MKNKKLNGETEKILLCFSEALLKLKTDYENLTQRKSIAWNFSNEMLAVKSAEAELCKTYLTSADYIPLKILSKEIIASFEEFEKSKKKIQAECMSNSDTAVFLFQKRSNQLFEKAFAKGQSLRKESGIDRNFEKEIMLFCKLKKDLCKNLFRFETDEVTESIAQSIAFEEGERFGKIDYLLKLR